MSLFSLPDIQRTYDIGMHKLTDFERQPYSKLYQTAWVEQNRAALFNTFYDDTGAPWRNGDNFLPTYDDEEAEGNNFIFCTGDKQRRAVILVGHPGIGKSSWLRYALTERLLARQTTLLQVDLLWVYVFNEAGVFLVQTQHLNGVIAAEFIPLSAWSLVDSNEVLLSVPEFHIGCQHLVIQAASPRKERMRWRRHLSVSQTLYLTKPMSLPELLAGRLLHMPVRSKNDVETFLNMFGPSMRGIYFEDLTDWEMNVQHIVSQLTYDRPAEYLHRITALDPDADVSHVLFLIQPGVTRKTWAISIASLYILDKMHHRYGESWSEMAARFYQLFLETPYTRAAAGQLLEEFIHRLLLSWCWSIVKLVEKRGPVNIIWRTAKPPVVPVHLVIGREGHAAVTVDLQAPGDAVVYRQLPVVYFDSQERLHLRDCTYYRLISSSHPTFDSFIYDSSTNTATVFQVTVSPTHSVNADGIVWLRQVMGVSGTIRYVAVTLPGEITLPVRPEVSAQIMDWYQLEIMQLSV
ncbi:hypothetical protein B0H10DRAFT_1938065 [Mycena sp. CBHHK59/15]|nr:hypothetical protein B0H10DRAFT_1938065 [Mycena sp. CBHHK59/15]